MKKAKNKTAKVSKMPESFDTMLESILDNKREVPNYAQEAANLRDSFLDKGFTTDQAFQLTLLVLIRGPGLDR